MSPLVSVIIPTRNRDSYLKLAIDSVYAQTYPNFEIIVVDDGSSDNTRDIVKAYDARLHYLSQKKQGAAAARNTGIHKARGDYIAFLDDDDIYASHKLQTCIDYFTQHPDIIWLCSGFSFIDANGIPLPRDPIVPQNEEITLHDIAHFTFINTCSIMVKREQLLASGGFPDGVTVSEDYHTWAKILQRGKGAALRDNLVYYRRHQGNTKLPPMKMFKENLRIIDAVLASKAACLQSRETYIKNLDRIILDNLIYERKPVRHAIFKWLRKSGYPTGLRKTRKS